MVTRRWWDNEPMRISRRRWKGAGPSPLTALASLLRGAKIPNQSLCYQLARSARSCTTQLSSLGVRSSLVSGAVVAGLSPTLFRALSENLTKQPLLRNFLHPLNREELDVGHRHPLGLQQQIPQVLIAPAAVNQH